MNERGHAGRRSAEVRALRPELRPPEFLEYAEQAGMDPKTVVQDPAIVAAEAAIMRGLHFVETSRQDTEAQSVYQQLHDALQQLEHRYTGLDEYRGALVDHLKYLESEGHIAYEEDQIMQHDRLRARHELQVGEVAQELRERLRRIEQELLIIKALRRRITEMPMYRRSQEKKKETEGKQCRIEYLQGMDAFISDAQFLSQACEGAQRKFYQLVGQRDARRERTELEREKLRDIEKDVDGRWDLAVNAFRALPENLQHLFPPLPVIESDLIRWYEELVRSGEVPIDAKQKKWKPLRDVMEQFGQLIPETRRIHIETKGLHDRAIGDDHELHTFLRELIAELNVHRRNHDLGGERLTERLARMQKLEENMLLKYDDPEVRQRKIRLHQIVRVPLDLLQHLRQPRYLPREVHRQMNSIISELCSIQEELCTSMY